MSFKTNTEYFVFHDLWSKALIRFPRQENVVSIQEIRFPWLQFPKNSSKTNNTISIICRIYELPQYIWLYYASPWIFDLWLLALHISRLIVNMVHYKQNNVEFVSLWDVSNGVGTGKQESGRSECGRNETPKADVGWIRELPASHCERVQQSTGFGLECKFLPKR